MRPGIRGWVLMAIALVFAWACGGGGGGGGGTPTDPVPGVTFTGASTGSNSISLVHANPGDANVLRLRVRANTVQDLYGVAFDLVFPETLLRFDAAVEGAFLSGAGGETALQVFQSAPGRLVVGATRLGPVAGASGSGNILEVELRILAAGSGSLGFENNRGFDSKGDAIAGLGWAGGTLRVIR